MRLHIAVGPKMPNWVQSGFTDYLRRFPKELPFDLTEIPAGKRSKNADVVRILEKEDEQMLAAVAKGNRIVTLDIHGVCWETPQLAQQLGRWKQAGRDVSFLVGGPEGMAPACKAGAEQSWSLSPLTLPHLLVRGRCWSRRVCIVRGALLPITLISE